MGTVPLSNTGNLSSFALRLHEQGMTFFDTNIVARFHCRLLTKAWRDAVDEVYGKNTNAADTAFAAQFSSFIDPEKAELVGPYAHAKTELTLPEIRALFGYLQQRTEGLSPADYSAKKPKKRSKKTHTPRTLQVTVPERARRAVAFVKNWALGSDPAP
ncbi:MAG: hypothetical protein EB059_03870 [Alphaproteobacteria bacterium]|nr:hypothetical protein [Alphaproteobacteria bacterium]